MSFFLAAIGFPTAEHRYKVTADALRTYAEATDDAPGRAVFAIVPAAPVIQHPIADDQTVRYADASADHFAIHLDDEFARSVGLPGRIVHGLCTMAFTGRAVLEAVGVDDPRAIRRLAARFSAPLFSGDTLTTSVWVLGDKAYGFVAAGADGTPVIKDGRAELQ